MYSFAAVVLLHAAFAYVMLTTNHVVSKPFQDIQVRFIEPKPPEKEEPRPPPPEVQEFNLSRDVDTPIPPVEVKVATTAVTPVEDQVEDVTRIVLADGSPMSGSLTGFTSKPRPSSRPHGMESYPVESLRAKESGKTMLALCISETGAIESIKVAKSSGFPRLDQAAIAIARDYSFKPAMLHGKPVAVCINYGISFSLNSLPQVQRPQSDAEAAPDVVEKLLQPPAPGNPDIVSIAKPVRMQTYLDLLKEAGVDCTPLQLRTIGQDMRDKRYVIEAQCTEQPNGLVAFIPMNGNEGKFEIMDCAAALSRHITCEFAAGQ